MKIAVIDGRNHVIRKIASNRFGHLLVVLNLVAAVWIYFNKPRVPGFRYDYYEEPNYYWVYRALTAVPDFITGYLLYPLFYFFNGPQNVWWSGPLFHLICLIFSTIQWQLVGFLLTLVGGVLVNSHKDIAK